MYSSNLLYVSYLQFRIGTTMRELLLFSFMEEWTLSPPPTWLTVTSSTSTSSFFFCSACFSSFFCMRETRLDWDGEEEDACCSSCAVAFFFDLVSFFFFFEDRLVTCLGSLSCFSLVGVEDRAFFGFIRLTSLLFSEISSELVTFSICR